MGEAAAATRTNNKRVEYHLCPATHWICFVSRIKSYLSLGYYYYASWVKSIDFSLVTCDETRALISCSALLFSALLCCRVYDISINQSFLKWLSHTSHTHTANNCVDAGKATLIMPIYRKCFVFVFRNVISIPKKTEAWHVHVIDIVSVGCAQNCRPFSIWFINNLAEIILRYWTKCYEEMSEINHFRSIADKCWGFMKLTHLFFAKRNQSELDVVDWIVIHFG